MTNIIDIHRNIIYPILRMPDVPMTNKEEKELLRKIITKLEYFILGLLVAQNHTEEELNKLINFINTNDKTRVNKS